MTCHRRGAVGASLLAVEMLVDLLRDVSFTPSMRGKFSHKLSEALCRSAKRGIARAASQLGRHIAVDRDLDTQTVIHLDPVN